MKHRVTLGVVCCARKTFDYKAAGEIYGRILDDLGRLENVSLEAIPGLVIEVEDARRAGAALAQKRVDGLVVISGTFHLGHLALELNRLVNRPILLWGLDELPYDGGKIRLNSVCGVNLDASNLYKAGVRNFHAIVQDSIDGDWVDAVRVCSALSEARVGIAGYHAHGFFNIDIDESSTFREMGVLVDHFELNDIFTRPVGKGDLAERKEQLMSVFDVSGISPEQLEKVAGLSARLGSFMKENGLTALALRCWPEFAASFGISPCAAMSLLQSEGHIIACEGDIDGALSMYAHAAAGAATPFLADLSQIDFQGNFALLWHCGVAPCSLWDGRCVRSLDSYFAAGKGVTADFVMKPGAVSICRIDSVNGNYRVFLEDAVGLPMDKELRGTYLKVEFGEPVRAVFNRIVYNGIAHHASVAYGRYRRPLELFARIKGWPVIA